jgi:drug/metabolite transporter (DMT)-like permease
VCLGISACWGANFAVIKYGMDALESPSDAPLFVAARFVVGALVLAPFAAQVSSRRAMIEGLKVGLLCAGGYALQAQALAMGTHAETAAFICSLQAVFVPLITSALGLATVSNRVWVAVALAVSGIACLELPAVVEGGVSSLCLGDFIALGQPVGFGLSYLVLEKAVKESPDDELPLAALQCMLIGAAFLAVPCASEGVAPWQLPWDHLLPAANGGSWDIGWAVAYLGVVSTAMTIWLQTITFKRLPAVDASLIISTEPLFATAAGVALLGDSVGLPEIAGGSLVISALCYSALGGADSSDDEDSR